MPRSNSASQSRKPAGNVDLRPRHRNRSSRSATNANPRRWRFRRHAKSACRSSGSRSRNDGAERCPSNAWSGLPDLTSINRTVFCQDSTASPAADAGNEYFGAHVVFFDTGASVKTPDRDLRFGVVRGEAILTDEGQVLDPKPDSFARRRFSFFSTLANHRSLSGVDRDSRPAILVKGGLDGLAGQRGHLAAIGGNRQFAELAVGIGDRQSIPCQWPRR